MKLALIATLASLSGAVLVMAQDRPWRLDHVNVVVRELDAARESYARLGFTIKQGRPHANSIRNLHLKFADLSEIELITADQPRDNLARRYRSLMAAGEGGAFFALRVDSGATLELRDSALLPEVFTTRLLRSPTDSAHHYAHANGAYALHAVWLATDSSDAVALGAFRLRPVRQAAAPLDRAGTGAVRFDGGTMLYAMPRGAGDAGVTRIIGATVAVRDAAQTAAYLQRALRLPVAVRDTPRGRSVLLPPALTHGMWLEFLEVR